MAINAVASGSSAQAVRPQPQADQKAELAKLAEQAKQTKLAEQADQAKPKPVVNPQGQTTGNIINTVA